jgi:enoyl-CoA hydratase/carnithine racemase
MRRYVRLEAQEGVGIIRIHRPPVNAMDEALIADLTECVREVSDREDVGSVVLTGEGSGFSAGADIQMMADFPSSDIAKFTRTTRDAFSMVERIPKVTIAAIHGYALGGGCELALCADFRFSDEDAWLGQPEILLGVIPGSGGTQRLPMLIGVPRAKELIYSGRSIQAHEAKMIGLVDEVVNPGYVVDRAVEVARRYARGPRRALRAAKEAINQGAQGPRDAGLALEYRCLLGLLGSSDQRERMDSFLGMRNHSRGQRPPEGL